MYRIKSVAMLVFFFSYGLSDELKNYETVTVVSSLPKLLEDTVLVVDKIDKEFLEKTQPKNLSSLLRESLAIDVSSNGGMGQLSSIFLRGSNSNHAVVKINGIKIKRAIRLLKNTNCCPEKLSPNACPIPGKAENSHGPRNRRVRNTNL
mgnify:CR=1 FL=1